MKSWARKTIRVKTPTRAYEVLVGSRLLMHAGEIVREATSATHVALVSDSNVTPLYAHDVAASLEAAGIMCTLITFPAGEQHKRFSTLEDILEKIAAARLTRDDAVVALGGGVTGDMAGLAAALYLRGCDVVQIPTSLLAMVDSSVGGKTAVDLSAGKNLAGAFLQPAVVIADIDCLSTLSPELFRDSCGEVIKHGVLADEKLFDELSRRPLTQVGYTNERLADIIATNIEIKRNVVVADEREKGVRQTLNLGHTIGHAVEAASNFTLGHGSSVACGLCCMARAAASKGWVDPSVARRIEHVVELHGLPTDTPLDHETIVKFAALDKKNHADGLNIIVPTKIGATEIRRVSPEEFRDLVDRGCGTTYTS
ncbi:MAG: 3-dehydroquinate synthase [Atopobiaceae bacterium]|jgi:3-dehydroquinate synthase